MRKKQKQQVMEMLKTLDEAHKQIRVFIKKKDYNAAIALMGQCQENAVVIGTAIENSEGEGTVAVSTLEDYCDIIYQVSQEMVSDIKGTGAHGMLSKQLKIIKEEIFKLPVKLEIAFFPYLASMWDSLESVWLAAKDDPNCECYVVPIPYYNKNPDGTFGTMYYEGDKYPHYVPVTNWQEYKLDSSKPDIAYIHNPYDELNYVASVHPDYYSSNLKKYVDVLAYIPYFVTGGMISGKAIYPAYIHADYIIPQSKNHVSFFSERIPPNKFLPLGSPKIDRIIRLCRNRSAPPDGWKEIMEGKKVFFFNTSISGLLVNTMTFLKKINYVFDTFKGRDDALILWRPHPLLESTIASMRPQFLQIYNSLKNKFCKENIGIYDDTPDIETSIAWSDVYIGDSGTSVTSLFGIAGKPIFVLDSNLNEDITEELGMFCMRGFCYENSDAWFIGPYNFLYYFNFVTKDLVPLVRVSEISEEGQYHDVFKTGDRLVIAPMNAQDVCIFENNQIRKIQLNYESLPGMAFNNAVIYKHYLFLIPAQYSSIVRLDLNTEKVSYWKISNRETNKSDDHFCGDSIWLQDSILYLAYAGSKSVMALDLENGKYKISAVDFQDSACTNMFGDIDNLWFLPQESSVITRWNSVTGDIKIYSQYPEGFKCFNYIYGFECNQKPFSSAVVFNDYILLIPYWANMFVKLDKATGEMSEWNPPFPTDFSPKNCNPYSFEAKLDDYSFYLFSNWDLSSYKVNVRDNTYEKFKTYLNEDFLYKNIYGFNQISKGLQYGCYEDGLNTLANFLDGKTYGKPFDPQIQKTLFEEICENADGTCGEKIHSSIMKIKMK